MFESALGLASATTRQNAGSRLYRAGSPPIHGDKLAGGVNDPAATICAEAIFAVGSARAARRSHDGGEGWVWGVRLKDSELKTGTTDYKPNARYFHRGCLQI